MKRKRIVCGVLCLLLAFGLRAPAWGEEDGFTEIRTVEDLERIQADPAGSYRLAADLDMTGLDWTPFDFQGVLDGAGHTVYNLTVTKTGGELRDTVDGNDKRYTTSFAGLFAALVDAEVKDLSLLGVDVALETDGHAYAGALAGYMDHSTVSGVTVSDARVSLTTTCQSNPEGPTNRCMAGVSGLVGFGHGTVTDCDVSSVLVFDDRSAPALRCEQFMGGILACGNATITNCRVSIAGYDMCRGYVHNGGLVGMFYRYDKSIAVGKIADCAVDGFISFFEENSDRRAYCKAFVGELLTKASVANCRETFTRDETYNYAAYLNPETCESPEITDTTVSLDCQWGYTEHSCAVCGNSWRDAFRAPEHAAGEWKVVEEASFEESGLRRRFCARCGELVQEEPIPPHVAGEWTVAAEPELGQTGLRQLLCADCGAVLEEEVLAALVAPEACVLRPEQLALRYREYEQLEVQVLPENASDALLLWSSSNPKAVTVNSGGTVHAVGPGSAVITCASADGQAHSECTVTVKLSFRQWVSYYLLLGWLLE